ncbi:MAG: hypothetical protein NDF52_08765 [archaeon YNP-WB-062]|nr:hypothetical protein [Candidatus Culexarchaeum yellowstonense]
MFLALDKSIDDVLWYNMLGDVVRIFKFRMVGPSPSKVQKPNAPGARDSVIF